MNILHIELPKNLTFRLFHYFNFSLLFRQQDAIVFRLYATTSNSDLKTLEENIQQLVNQSKIVLGPVKELPEIYTARGSEQFTE